jgi:pteridine reductase
MMRKTSLKSNSRPVALVTGAASFLGRAISLKLACEGFDLLLHYQSSMNKTKKLAAEARCLGAKASVVKADLRKVERVQSFIQMIFKTSKRMDLLVNNASLFYPTPFSKTILSQWQELFSVNLFSPYFLSRAVSPLLKKSHGCIVNLTDIYGENPILKDYSAYCASKAGLITITKILSKELGPFVRVNAVSPGAVFIPKTYSLQQREKLIGRSALKRQGRPEDIAEAVYFLASQRFITGQVLKVDGGRFF